MPSWSHFQGVAEAQVGAQGRSEATEKGTGDNVTPSPPQTKDSSFAWKVSLFEYSKLPLRKSLMPFLQAQPLSPQSPRVAELHRRPPAEGPIHGVAVAWVQPPEASLPSQPRSKPPSPLPSPRERPPKGQQGHSDLPHPSTDPSGGAPGHGTDQQHRTKRGAFRVPAQLSRLWATLASRLLSLAGHKGSF